MIVNEWYRFTNPGDTVAIVGAEVNKGLEVALERGRRIEVYAGKEIAHTDLEGRLHSAFMSAFKEGHFQVSSILHSR